MFSDRCDYDLIDGGFSVKDPNDPNVFVHVTNEDLDEFFKFLWANFPDKIADAKLTCGQDSMEIQRREYPQEFFRFGRSYW